LDSANHEWLLAVSRNETAKHLIRFLSVLASIGSIGVTKDLAAEISAADGAGENPRLCKSIMRWNSTICPNQSMNVLNGIWR
jgi:hypothetical protein